MYIALKKFSYCQVMRKLFVFYRKKVEKVLAVQFFVVPLHPLSR